MGRWGRWTTGKPVILLVCACVYGCKSLCVCMYLYTCVHVYMCMDTCVCLCLYVHVYVICMCARMWMCVCRPLSELAHRYRALIIELREDGSCAPDPRHPVGSAFPCGFYKLGGNTEQVVIPKDLGKRGGQTALGAL